MAIVQNTLLGRAKGRVGNVVFSTHKGQNILKQKPEVVANPRSASQQANRARFIALMALGRTLRPILAQGFKEYANRVSWLNRFMSTNSYSGLLSWDSEALEWEAEFKNIVISEGQLLPSLITTSWADDLLAITWDSHPYANQSLDDRLFYVVMAGNSTFYGLGQNTRAEESVTPIPMPIVGVPPMKIYIAYFWQSPDGRIVSNSYCNVITAS